MRLQSAPSTAAAVLAPLRAGRAPRRGAPRRPQAAHLRGRERRGVLVVRRERAHPSVAHGDRGCDRIFRMRPVESSARPSVTPVSSGKGATTCSYFLPGDQQVIYASTHLGGDACPPRPITARATSGRSTTRTTSSAPNADGSGVTRLTDTQGYDAEATVCAKDGSIIFTSVRDGDIDLYRMDADGKNVKRLTNTPGYDGGAFFNADCTKIVWRASRPKPGKELDEYQELLAQKGSCARRSSSSTSPTPMAPTPRRSRTSMRLRSRRSCTRRRSASSSRRTTAIPRAANSTSGRSTSTARTSSASPMRRRLRRLSDVLARRASTSRSRRTGLRPGQARHQRVRRPLGRSASASRVYASRVFRAARAADRVMSDIGWLADPAARRARHRHPRARAAGELPREALPRARAFARRETPMDTGNRSR